MSVKVSRVGRAMLRTKRTRIVTTSISSQFSLIRGKQISSKLAPSSVQTVTIKLSYFTPHVAYQFFFVVLEKYDWYRTSELTNMEMEPTRARIIRDQISNIIYWIFHVVSSTHLMRKGVRPLSIFYFLLWCLQYCIIDTNSELVIEVQVQDKIGFYS